MLERVHNINDEKRGKSATLVFREKSNILSMMQLVICQQQ